MPLRPEGWIGVTFSQVLLHTLMQPKVGCQFSGVCIVLSRLFLGGAAPPYSANIPPYQCFRGCCNPHKNDGMQS